MAPFDAQITFCYTDDLPRTGAWYEQVLALERVIDQGSCWIYQVAGQGFLGFCERSSVGIDHDDLILTLVTDDVDDWYDRVVARGGIVSGAPEANEAFGIYHFFVRDPNGYRIEIQRFLSPEDRNVCHPQRAP